MLNFILRENQCILDMSKKEAKETMKNEYIVPNKHERKKMLLQVNYSQLLEINYGFY